jgi:hypothetical protein
MYCVPTACVNWMAYFANRGASQPFTLAGPRDWQSQDNYVRASDVIGLMGTLMETDPVEGTKGGGLDGLRDYLGVSAAGDFTANRFSVWSGGGSLLNSATLTLMHSLGGYMVGGYGKYASTTGGTRSGGHAITVTGMWDPACGDTDPILQFRDPNFTYNDPFPGGSNQSQFTTNMAVMTPVTALFRPDPDNDYEFLTLQRLDKTGPSKNFLDNLYCIFPAAGLIVDPGRAAQLDLIRPFRPTGNPAPALRSFNVSSSAGTVKDVVFAADQLNYYYSADGANGAASGVWKLNALTGGNTRIVSLTGGTTAIPAGPIAVSRLGDLYMIVGNSIHRYDLSDPNSAPVSSITGLSPLPLDIAYDDKNDTVVVITAPPQIGSRRVLRIGRTLPSSWTTYDLLVNVSGTPGIAPDADTAGAYFVCGSQSSTVYRVSVQNGDLATTHVINNSATGITGLNVTDANTLVYAAGGVLLEKQMNSFGTWVNRAGSRWAGRPAGGPIALARSRSNHTAIENSASFNNVAEPDPYPFLPPCYPNCDLSTTAPSLNVADFTCFLQKYTARDVYANCDNSTATPALNVADFTCFLQKYAAGCP